MIAKVSQLIQLIRSCTLNLLYYIFNLDRSGSDRIITEVIFDPGLNYLNSKTNLFLADNLLFYMAPSYVKSSR